MANFTGAIHIILLSGTHIMLTSKGGVGLDALAAIRLEVSVPEIVAGSSVVIASLITVFLFANRESSDQKIGDYLGRLVLLFYASWMVAFSTLAVKGNQVNAERALKREAASGRQRTPLPRTSVTTPVVVLPRQWSCFLVAITFFSYTVPSTCRAAFHDMESLRGASGALSNMAFVGHLLMLTTDTRSSAPRVLISHAAVHNFGAASRALADARHMGVGWGVVSSALFSMAVCPFELWIWLLVLRPMLVRRNKQLHDNLPLTIFHYLSQKGGLTMGLYLYFENVGVGMQGMRSLEDIVPWIDANNVVLSQFALSAVLAATLFADSRTSVLLLLRGKAPWYVTVGFALATCTSLVAMTLFAGREFSGDRQLAFSNLMWYLFTLLWGVTFGVMAAAASSRYEQGAGGDNLEIHNVPTVATLPAVRSDDEEKSHVERREPSSRRVSFTTASGGSAMSSMVV